MSAEMRETPTLRTVNPLVQWAKDWEKKSNNEETN